MAMSGGTMRDKGGAQGSERRQFPRVAAHVQVYFQLSGRHDAAPVLSGDELSARALDASLGGVSLLTPQPMLPGAPSMKGPSP